MDSDDIGMVHQFNHWNSGAARSATPDTFHGCMTNKGTKQPQIWQTNV